MDEEILIGKVKSGPLRSYSNRNNVVTSVTVETTIDEPGKSGTLEFKQVDRILSGFGPTARRMAKELRTGLLVHITYDPCMLTRTDGARQKVMIVKTFKVLQPKPE